MYRTRSLLGVALAIQNVLFSTEGFKYSLDDASDSSKMTYSEGWMYGTDKGPFGASQGESYVQTEFNVTVIPHGKPSSALEIKVMFYRSMVLVFDDEVNVNICPENPGLYSTFMDVTILPFKITSVEGGDEGENIYRSNVTTKHNVEESGLQHVLIQVCPVEVNVRTLSVEGELTFHNPYGYLPGMDYGCLPFELVRVLASMALCVFLGFLIWHHHTTVLPVHRMIVGVVVLSTFEALSWLVAYRYMNITGKPTCCPYPGSVILAMALTVLRQTVSRLLLLVICLGYGITRIELEKREVVFIVVLTIAFFASGVLQLMSSVTSYVRSGERYIDTNPVLAIPAIVTDMIYLTWIYGTLANMIKELKEVNETYKLKMFKALAWTLGTFVTFSTLLNVAILAAEGSPDQSWEWKWTWIQVVLWQMLNLCMLLAVSIIWRPSPRSAMLAYSKQLATTETDAEEAEGIEMEAVELQGPGAGHFIIGEDGDESDGGHPEGKKDADADGGAGGKNGNVYSMANFEPQRDTDFT